jgi:hypothetical protein
MIFVMIRRDQLPYVLLCFLPTFTIYYLAVNYDDLNKSFIYRLPTPAVSSGVLLKPKRIQPVSPTEGNNRGQSLDSNKDNMLLDNNSNGLQPRENSNNWCKTVLKKFA